MFNATDICKIIDEQLLWSGKEDMYSHISTTKIKNTKMEISKTPPYTWTESKHKPTIILKNERMYENEQVRIQRNQTYCRNL